MSIIYQVIAAFGGGVFGALIGGANAFILTGITGLISVVLIMSGGGDSLLISVPGGVYLAPHVGFAGGVAALSVMNKHKKESIIQYEKMDAHEITEELENQVKVYRDIAELSISSPLYPFSNTLAILTGGLFGSAGYILNYYIARLFYLNIDTIALTVVISNILVRLLIEKDEVIKLKDKNIYINIGKKLFFNFIWSIPFSFLVSYVTISTGFEQIVFYISAFSLILNLSKQNIPVTHHISLTAGYATLALNNIWIGVVIGVIAMVMGEYIDAIVNSEAKSLIDMPSTVIAILSFIIFTIF